MTLPSQFGRPTSRSNNMFRRRRSGRKAFVSVLVGLLVVTFLVWRWLGPGGDQPSPAYAGDEGERDSQQVANESSESQTSRDLSGRARPRASDSGNRSRDVSSPGQPRIEMGQPVDQSVTERAGADSSARNAPDETSQTRRAERSDRAEPQPDSSRASSPAQQRARERMRLGKEMLAGNRPIDGRLMLTEALDSGELDAKREREIRRTLTDLNERLVFSPQIVRNDPYVFGYTIRPGDALSKLPRSQDLKTDWRFIQRINRITRPEAIRAGQQIKLVTGPFHAVVYKQQFRMDVYMGEIDGERVFVRSFAVGLGEYDSTPVGTFSVRANSKLINPEWTNPRTGERFLPDDPKNPIGERWIGLRGVSEGVRDLGGYGIHGTIDPQSIGQQASMGCVRMHAEDVELVYEMLVEDASTITIVDG